MNDTFDTTPSRQQRQRAALDKVVAHFGSMQTLARALDISYQAIQGWRESGVPFERCAELETLVRGAVQCHELNEDWLRVTTRPYGKGARHVA